MHAILRRPLPVLLAAVMGLPGCSHTPGVSNGSVSVCFRAIPVGREAVHDQGAKLIGVHRVPVDSVRDRLPPATRDQLAAENDLAVCEMTFRGPFRPGQVDMAQADQGGQFAVVLVSSRGLHLVGAVVLSQLPHGLGGRTV